MTMVVSAWLGVAFLGLSVLATFTMYRFWGYPFDKEARKSECPQWKMHIHRAIGFAYVLLYLVFMSEMVPRLWAYQVEFPARTVAHICLGISIGVILLVKISILRWFRHFEEWMPVLGTLLMLCTFLLVGLSVPYVLKERALAGAAVGGSAFSEESRERVAALLPGAGLADDVDLEALSTERALREGRQVLLHKCVYCHDLKTAIASPRTPSAWFRTVRRMADKPSLGSPILPREQRRVTAYLIAITPDLQRSVKEKREEELAQERAREAADEMIAVDGPELPKSQPSEPAPERGAGEVTAGEEEAQKPGSRPDRPRPAPVDPAPTEPAPGAERAEPAPARRAADAGAPDEAGAPNARADAGAPVEEVDGEGDARAGEAAATFERMCSLCHSLEDIRAAPPRSARETREVIRRMVGHGLSASERELRLIEEHMIRLFVE